MTKKLQKYILHLLIYFIANFLTEEIFFFSFILSFMGHGR